MKESREMATDYFTDTEIRTAKKFCDEQNNIGQESGIEARFSFEVNDMAIHDPFNSECGRFTVDPVQEYGLECFEYFIEISHEIERKDKQMKRAFQKYGKDVCKRCYEMSEEGNGASTIGFEYDLTTQQADCAIYAYEYYLTTQEKK